MKVFWLLGFEIEISSNLEIANFRGIIFDLTNNTFKPLPLKFSKICKHLIILMSIPITWDQ